MGAGHPPEVFENKGTTSCSDHKICTALLPPPEEGWRPPPDYQPLALEVVLPIFNDQIQDTVDADLFDGIGQL